MSEHTKIHLTPTQMRQLARYELTFKDILPEDVLAAVLGEDPETEDSLENGPAEMFDAAIYLMTLDDLTTALHNMQAANPTVGDLYRYWFGPIDMLDDLFGLDHARGFDDDHIPGTWAGMALAMIQESADFAEVWWMLEDVCRYDHTESHLSELIHYDRMYQDLSRRATNRCLPVEEWIFSTHEMEQCLHPFENNDALAATLTEDERALVRTMIEELIQTDSTLALHIKGYSCYGGNALYDCDWDASRDCITRLYELTDDPQYANTLGYIYYYGRCNQGTPEYDKAFRYYEVAAANGLHEGLYKLADMYWHGYGCKKSPGTANNLYRMVYADSLRQFLAGGMGNLADAALRMGNIYAQGIDEEIDPEHAYYYYLQAVYAARLRAQESDSYGNDAVVHNAERALEEVRQDLPEDYYRSYIDEFVPMLFYELAEDRYRCELRCTQLDGNTWRMRGFRTKSRRGPEPESILMTVPEIGLCERTTAVTMTAVNVTEIWFASDTTFRFDEVAWSEDEDRHEFYYDDVLVAWVRCGALRVYGRPVEEPHGPEYRMVSVCFHPGGRSYDYICDLDDVQVGDTVIVNGYDGETEVEVVAVRTVRKSELSMPVERYKKVVRKA